MDKAHPKTVSKYFGLGKSQAELDFLDVVLDRDNRLYIDPFALSLQADRWSVEAHQTLVSYFDQVIAAIRDGREGDARELLTNLNEPNETRLGESAAEPQGAGIGEDQAGDLFDALKASKAVKTGLLSSLEECELFVKGISWDKISDLTTNVIRRHLAEYTTEQCELHGIPYQEVALPPYYDAEMAIWISAPFDVPVVDGLPLVLVPRSIARRKPAYDHRHFYNHFVLTTLQVQHLAANTSLVKSLKNKKKKAANRRVYKKDLKKQYPLSKEYLAEFIRNNPDVLKQYRKELERTAEKTGGKDDDELISEFAIADALREALKHIQRGAADASKYHSYMIGVLEFLFYPNLGRPKKEKEIHDGRKRIDILMENCAVTGIFHRLPNIRKFPSAFVAFECKNYRSDIANPELDQIAGRFSTNRGKVGFVCCRSFEDRALFVARCRDTFKDDRGLICPLDDSTIDKLLAEIATGRRDRVDDLIAELIDEVWVA